MRLWEFIKTYMLQTPFQKVQEDQAELTFEEITIWAELFAKKLKGIQCCAILCKSEMAASMALLACFAAEVTALPLSMRYGELHCNKILDTIRPDAVITDEDGLFHIRTFTDSRYIEPPQHPALIMCTSGTTGTPKGAMLSEENIMTNVSDIAAYFDIDTTDTILISRPLYHCAVLTGEFLTALTKGAKIRFYSQSFNPAKMLELIKQYQITAFCGTPTLLCMMGQLNRRDSGDSLKSICISGECMGKEAGLSIARAFPHADIYHIYGLTEACPRVSYLPPNLFDEFPDYVGIPLNSVQVKILDTNGNRVPIGQDGTLWVKGGNVMLGYYNEPEKTSKTLKNGWLCTGDIAQMNEYGLLKIKGRSDHLIIKAGMNIYPAEIEDSLKMDHRVRDVLVYGFDTAYGIQIGMKIVGDFNTIAEVKRLCSEFLPTYQIPVKIEIVDSLPKNSSGKIIRRVENA